MLENYVSEWDTHDALGLQAVTRHDFLNFG